MILLFVLINNAGYEKENETIGSKITKAVGKREEMKAKHFKYVDDMTLAQAINLKQTLEHKDNNAWTRPVPYHSRFELALPDGENKMQDAIYQLYAYTIENEMRINKKKTKVMIFNEANIYDVMPHIEIETGEALEVVEEFKLLGVIMTSDLKWNMNTKHITQKGYQRLWMIRRLKQLGASETELKDVYEKQVRSILEFSPVVWHPGLTKENAAQIERVQKSAFAIILGQNYISYENSLLKLNMKTLSSRRETLSLKFAKKAMEHPRHSTWFETQTDTVNTRSVKLTFKPAITRTERLRKSPIPYMTSLLNNNVQ